MVDMFTPEVIAIVITALAALTLLTFLMLLIYIISQSKIKKRLLITEEKLLALEEKQAALRQDRQRVNSAVTNFAEAAQRTGSIEQRLDEIENNNVRFAEATDKIESIDRRLNECDKSIAKSHHQLAGHESKLKEHDTLFGQTGELMGKKAAGFNQAVQRIRILEEEFQGLKVFQRTFEQTRNRILNVLGGVPVETSPQNTPTTEQKDSKEETVIPPEGNLPQHRRLS